MHYSLINNFNSLVDQDDITYFLGDMSFGSPAFTKVIIDSLHGTKVLILGNHDRGSNACYSMGFDVVLNSASIMIGEHKVNMTHMPPCSSFYGDINKKFTVNYNSKEYFLHGHRHSVPKNKINNNEFDVGVTGNDYKPVSISEIESWIDKHEQSKLND